MRKGGVARGNVGAALKTSCACMPQEGFTKDAARLRGAGSPSGFYAVSGKLSSKNRKVNEHHLSHNLKKLGNGCVVKLPFLGCNKLGRLCVIVNVNSKKTDNSKTRYRNKVVDYQMIVVYKICMFIFL